MKTSTIVWILIGLAVIIGAGYWWSQSQSAPQVQGAPSTAMGLNGSPNQGNLGGADTGAPQQPQGDGSGVSSNFALGIDGSTSLGSYLVAYNGMTVYTYSPDTGTPGKSSCTGTCAQNWPPYVVPAGSVLNLQAGVTGAISTIARADGTTQVTYKGKPLYFYVKDQQSGDTKGQGVGGVWYVVKP